MTKKFISRIVVSVCVLCGLSLILLSSLPASPQAQPVPPQDDPLFSWQHATMVSSLLIPFLLFWMDSRGQMNKHHMEIMEQQQQLHVQNMERFKTLETKIEPLWAWWNRNQKGDRR
jgi:hypothetical protein